MPSCCCTPNTLISIGVSASSNYAHPYPVACLLLTSHPFQAFKELLVEKNIGGSWSWDMTMRAIVSDERWVQPYPTTCDGHQDGVSSRMGVRDRMV